MDMPGLGRKPELEGRFLMGGCWSKTLDVMKLVNQKLVA